MRVFVAPHSDSMGKFQGIVQAFPGTWDGFILDVGCRSGKLKCAFSDKKGKYFGLDLFPPADIIANLEKGLPFANESFDTVVALDILEHTDNIYKAFSELCRVAHKYIVVTLPNAYEVTNRLKFLFGKRSSDKYGLPLNPPRDRHRWTFSLREGITFTHARGQLCGFRVAVEGCLVGPRRGFSLSRLVVASFPNLLSPCYLALLERNHTE